MRIPVLSEFQVKPIGMNGLGNGGASVWKATSPSWHARQMSSPTIWSAGRYEAVAERIAPIAAELIAAVDRRAPVSDAALVDLACGTGSAAIAAAKAGARVTALDITPDLVSIGAQKAQAAGLSITWFTADASATGLPDASFDVAVSNMGIIFVEPVAQVAEFSRLLKVDGTLGFSSWVHDTANPFFNPIVSVLGALPSSGYSPDQWGDADTITARLSTDFDDVKIEAALHTWQYPSLDAAMRFLANESPMHVSVLGNVDQAQHDQLLTAFEAAMRAHTDADGRVSFDSPYVVVTARRR
jgi:ubiquinone/menaquinone biosynthesis C-methylase UbiE